MSNHAAPARTTTAIQARHQREAGTPSPVAGLLACLLILAGGALTGHAYLDQACSSATTATGHQLCAALTQLDAATSSALAR